MKRVLIVSFFIALALASSTTGISLNVCEKSEIATLRTIKVSSMNNSLLVYVKPSNSVVANFPYQVDLYERGSLRSSGTVVWTQIGANTRITKIVSFPISSEEAHAYALLTQKQLRGAFSIKVHE